MGDMNSLLVDAIAEYMRMNGRGMVFSPEIERQIGRPLGRSMEQANENMQRKAVIDALQRIQATPQQPTAPAAPMTPSNGFIRG